MPFSPVEVPRMPPESSFQMEQNGSKQLILLEDVQIPQQSKDKFSSLLEKDYNSIVSKSPMDVGEPTFFKWIFQQQACP